MCHLPRKMHICIYTEVLHRLSGVFTNIVRLLINGMQCFENP